MTWEPMDHDADLPSRIMVYLTNGRDPWIGCDLRWRTPIKHKGRWFVRDHGLVPITAKQCDGG